MPLAGTPLRVRSGARASAHLYISEAYVNLGRAPRCCVRGDLDPNAARPGAPLQKSREPVTQFALAARPADGRCRKLRAGLFVQSRPRSHRTIHARTLCQFRRHARRRTLERGCAGGQRRGGTELDRPPEEILTVSASRGSSSASPQPVRCLSCSSGSGAISSPYSWASSTVLRR